MIFIIVLLKNFNKKSQLVFWNIGRRNNIFPKKLKQNWILSYSLKFVPVPYLQSRLKL